MESLAPDRKALKMKAKELGAVFTKMTTKKVGFSDLARAEKTFVYFEALSWTGENRWDDLKAAASEHGFVLGSKGI